jgi:hypothetical protein
MAIGAVNLALSVVKIGGKMMPLDVGVSLASPASVSVCT